MENGAHDRQSTAACVTSSSIGPIRLAGTLALMTATSIARATELIPSTSPDFFSVPPYFTPLLLGIAVIFSIGLGLHAHRLRRDLVIAQRRIQRADEKTRQLGAALDQTADMVMITDGHGRIQYVNPAFTNVTGYTLEEVHERTPAILRSGLHDAEFYERLWQTIRGGDVFEGDFINRRKDGRLFYSRTVISPLRDDTSNREYFLAIAADVTERRVVEAARLVDDELAHSARLNVISELVASLAHEISQPLTAIMNYAHGCVRRASMPDTKTSQLLEPLKQIVLQGQRTASTVQRLREFAMQREPQRAESNINHIVTHAASQAIGDVNRHGVSVALELSPDLPNACVDSAQIEQVVLNLVRNGAEALAKEEIPTRELCLRTALTERNEIEMSVSDTGPGLSPAQTAKLFEPFFTTKAHGVGLGLAISRNIVEAHGGRLWVTPNPNRGVTFHFTVPIEAHDYGSGNRLRC